MSQPAGPAAHDCPVCGATTLQVLQLGGKAAITSTGRIVQAGADVRVCTRCSHCITLPTLDLAAYYANDYGIHTGSQSEDDLYAMQDGVALYRCQHMARVLAGKLDALGVAGRGLHVLDYGCGKSLTMRHLQAELPGVQVHLYDVSTDYVPYWNGFVDPANQACHALPAHWAGRFGLVTSFFSLEHVDDPRTELARIHGLLQPGGLLVAIVPAMHSQNVADMLVVDHVQHYTEPSMRCLLGSAGYSLVAADHVSHQQASIYVASKCGHGSLPAEALTGVAAADIAAAVQHTHDIAAFWSACEASIAAFERRHAADGGRCCIAGAGILGSHALSRLQQPGRCMGFIDSNRHKQQQGWQGLPVHAPGTLATVPGLHAYSGLNAVQEARVLPALLPAGLPPGSVWTLGSVPVPRTSYLQQLRSPLPRMAA